MPLGPLLRTSLAITRCTSVEPWSPSAKPFAVYNVAFQNISWIPSRVPGFWSRGLLHKIMFANWVSRLRSWGLWLRALWRFMQSCLRILVPSECHGFRYSSPFSFTKNIVCKWTSENIFGYARHSLDMHLTFQMSRTFCRTSQKVVWTSKTVKMFWTSKNALTSKILFWWKTISNISQT